MNMAERLSLDRLMLSPRLPTLPAVALRVLELSRDRSVRLGDLGKAIQHDQALCVKVLRTINSSFYGLARPCPSIERAMTYLGINAVRSLALGFSLVESMDGGKEHEAVSFDFVTYWRRAVYSATAARRLASQTRLCEPEEAFLGALLQDVGMVAIHRAAGEVYLQMVDMARKDHRRLPVIENRNFDFNHAEAGATLGERWRLPGALTAAIRFHHGAQFAPAEHRDVARLVEVATLAAEALTPTCPAVTVTDFLAATSNSFAINPGTAEEIFDRISEDALQLSRALGLDTGPRADVQALLREAKALRSRKREATSAAHDQRAA